MQKKRIYSGSRQKVAFACRWVFSCALLPLALTACEGCGSPPVVDGGVLGSEVSVVINELVADNDTGLPDEQGNFSDWIELKNTGAAEISLAGYSLSDDELDLRKYLFPQDFVLAAGEYVVIYADKAPELGGLHADFKLSKNGESLFLSDAQGTLVDEITWGAQYLDIAYGRSPDGEGEFDFLQTPTPGAENSGVRTEFPDAGTPPTTTTDAGVTAMNIFVNEVVTRNVNGLVDEQGEYEPWAELFNGSTEIQQLDGHFLSDDGAELDKWRFSSGTFLEPFGHIVVFLDREPLEGPLHADLSFSASGGILFLSGPDGTVVDELAYPAMDIDEAFGRFPDGDTQLDFVEPSPNAANVFLGTNDAGTNDAGTNDAGTNDAGTNDAGTNDAGG